LCGAVSWGRRGRRQQRQWRRHGGARREWLGCGGCSYRRGTPGEAAAVWASRGARWVGYGSGVGLLGRLGPCRYVFFLEFLPQAAEARHSGNYFFYCLIFYGHPTHFEICCSNLG
jgi:hypothetical protein